MDEKRRHERYPIEVRSSYQFLDDPYHFKEITINNVSAGGFAFLSDEKLKIGAELKFTVGNFPEQPFMIIAKVTWLEKQESSRLLSIGVQIAEGPGPNFDKFLDFYLRQSKEVG